MVGFCQNIIKGEENWKGHVNFELKVDNAIANVCL